MSVIKYFSIFAILPLILCSDVDSSNNYTRFSFICEASNQILLEIMECRNSKLTPRNVQRMENIKKCTDMTDIELFRNTCNYHSITPGLQNLLVSCIGKYIESKIPDQPDALDGCIDAMPQFPKWKMEKEYDNIFPFDQLLQNVFEQNALPAELLSYLLYNFQYLPYYLHNLLFL